MYVSVIVSNLNGKRFLPRLIETARAQEGVTPEIIVVDRESKDGSREYLQSLTDVRMITEPAITGLVAGYHAGVKHASHELLFFCNEDMWFDSKCLSKLARHISLDARIGAVDPWQWFYDGSQWIHGGTRFYSARFHRTSSYPPRGYDFTVPLQSGDEIPFACAGAVLIHKRMYVETGGWDTSFFLDCEDVDFFLRAWQRGWRCVVEPEAKVFHAVGMSNQQVLKPGTTVASRRYIYARSNRVMICLKYFSGFSLLWAPAIQFSPLLSNLAKLRFGKAHAEVQALVLTLRRLPGALRFRRQNRAFAKQKPGQAYFRELAFQKVDVSSNV